MWDAYEETCFSQIIFTNRLNRGLLLQAWVEKLLGVVAHWLSSQEKVLGTVVNKEC